MRQNTRLFKRLDEVLEKSEKLFLSGKPRSINFLIDNTRICGKDIKNLVLSEKTINFNYLEKDYSLSISNIVAVKRLRTRKFLFIFSVNKDVKIEKPIIEDVQPSENEE